MTYRYKIAIIFLLGFFIDCINIFMSAVALPDIAQQMSVSESAATWVANSYILGLTLIMPISRWLAQRFGARTTLTISMLVFAGSALGAGNAEHFTMLVFWRFLQGLGGGLLIPVGQALTFDLFKTNERAKISTLIMAVALIAPALSPAAGGVIVDTCGWRWVFLSHIPFSLMAAWLSWRWIDKSKTLAPSPDFRGLILISAALTCLLYGLSVFASANNPLPPGLAITAGLMFAGIYFRYQRSRPHAIVDLTVLKSPRLSFAVWVYHAIPGVFTGANLLTIFHLQQELGWSASDTGLLMMVYATGALLAIVASGRLYNHAGPQKLFFGSLLLHAGGIASFAVVNHPDDGLWLLLAYGLTGIGGGIAANTAQTTALIDFRSEPLARASVVWNLNRQIAFSAGTVVIAMIFNTLQGSSLAPLAYPMTFLFAALFGLTPLLGLHTLAAKSEYSCQAPNSP
ncbi:MFS transporter [Marinobacter xestospongiae]|uniref:MFS transporter n=1 Tax=Marinobacter xestospongiae TaxID=994319 RepID=A0ABU3W479_9GAMM|nr:MFS transporter [Marinobacter xestospongiae]MDV2080987.1 MFS transporter [Marinobacter xestospongiae]